MTVFRHVSVLPREVLSYLAPRSGGVYLDGTLGGGGHAEQVLEASGPDGRLIGFDRDPAALAAAGARLARFGDRLTLIHDDFANAAERVAALGITAIDGFLLDLGVSSHQLDAAARGFSFQADAPLDMRMNPEDDMTAADLVNNEDEAVLKKIIRDFGEEHFAGRVARRIVQAREEAPLETTLQLAEVVKKAIPRAKWEERIHPATRTFQALRIAVNHELESVEKGVDACISLLRKGGRGVVISFHSLEDRLVKLHFRAAATGCTCPPALPLCVCGKTPAAKILTSKPVMAGEGEVAENPRSRSAKMRVLEKVQ